MSIEFKLHQQTRQFNTSKDINITGFLIKNYKRKLAKEHSNEKTNL